MGDEEVTREIARPRTTTERGTGTRMTAARSFDVDTLGRLTIPNRVSRYITLDAPARPHRSRVITPGINRAQCEYHEHPAPDLACICGLRAYQAPFWLDVFPQTPSCGIESVVDVSGRIVHDAMEARAEELRVVAVVDPTPRTPAAPTKWDRFSEDLARHPWVVEVTGVILVAAAIAGLALAFMAAFVDTMTGTLLGSPFALGAFAALFALAKANGRGADLLTARRLARGVYLPGEPRFDLIARNYPDVAIYPTREEMLAAHPLTSPQVNPRPGAPAVPTPGETPDFWSRRAPW